MSKPTRETYTEFQTAYDFFNQKLFDNQLPDCLITYQRKAKTKGYFADGRFENALDGKIIDEIAMNPDYFRSADSFPETASEFSPKTILSTLVHEMCHLWQKYHGQPGRSRYHNQEWAEKMLQLGLHPTDDGTPNGKMTGDRVSHLIIPGGAFDRVCEELLEKIKLAWVDRWTGKVNPGAKLKNKTKYVCPQCKLNVWGKPELQIICGVCNRKLEVE
ncbi:MAG TPA: SprT-like domain-containing protein [Bacillota bacterium]|nr:SprT-like domain-containing protein [Bacillota bacterium]